MLRDWLCCDAGQARQASAASGGLGEYVLDLLGNVAVAGGGEVPPAPVKNLTQLVERVNLARRSTKRTRT